MGYLSIRNLYQDKTILLFRECWALEKIHGTSAHIAWRNGTLHLHSGGAKNERFVALFDEDKLTAAFQDLGYPDVTIYGEAYGGSILRMSTVYGAAMRFVAFDMLFGEHWSEVPRAAETITNRFGLEFVDFVRVPTDLEALDAERDKPSVQAVRNGILTAQHREGVVLRPLQEMRQKNGERIIAKHKGAAFSETTTPIEVDGASDARLVEAQAIADQWVTGNRMDHVLDHLGYTGELSMEMVPNVVKEMQADVERESTNLVHWDKAANKAVGKAAVYMFKARVHAQLREPEVKKETS